MFLHGIWFCVATVKLVFGQGTLLLCDPAVAPARLSSLWCSYMGPGRCDHLFASQYQTNSAHLRHRSLTSFDSARMKAHTIDSFSSVAGRRFSRAGSRIVSASTWFTSQKQVIACGVSSVQKKQLQATTAELLEPDRPEVDLFHRPQWTPSCSSHLVTVHGLIATACGRRSYRSWYSCSIYNIVGLQDA